MERSRGHALQLQQSVLNDLAIPAEVGVGVAGLIKVALVDAVVTDEDVAVNEFGHHSGVAGVDGERRLVGIVEAYFGIKFLVLFRLLVVLAGHDEIAGGQMLVSNILPKLGATAGLTVVADVSSVSIDATTVENHTAVAFLAEEGDVLLEDQTGLGTLTKCRFALCLLDEVECPVLAIDGSGVGAGYAQGGGGGEEAVEEDRELVRIAQRVGLQDVIIDVLHFFISPLL